MADRIKGITIELDGDMTMLSSALKVNVKPLA
jgi:phage-related minor tail protein